jgi:exodeoxyribonuclease VII small subunit
MTELKFEQALKRLEKIVEELEKGELALEDALKYYEEGIKLSSFCTKKLEETERKVEILTKNENGEFKKVPYEESEQSREVAEEESYEEKLGAKATKPLKKKKKIGEEGILFDENK